VRNEEVLRTVKGEKNIIHTIKRRTVNWIGHILRMNCMPKHVIEGKVEGRIEVREDEEEDVSNYWMIIRTERLLEIEIGSTRSHSV